MRIELSEQAYELLQRLSEQRGDASLTETLDAVLLHSQTPKEEAQRIRALVDEGIRSSAEEPLVDGEAFFQELRSRRSKAA